ncbi:nucleoside hydrolase-like domain-containing protein [Croceibacterium sp. TMG7-5b_MA50]|uniref:nucleoside hydrolase-like domain-containing protein n=1 Tax=Croceibacterium sp. TMG7-5b_MA50 TaxID=3121290 RepID=UPI003221EE91
MIGSASAAAPGSPTYLETPPGQKPRVVITTDPELDDSNSLVRYLLYSADFRTEGLIYASSQFHWSGDGQREAIPDGRDYRRLGRDLCPCLSWRWAPGERFIDEAVAAYAGAFPNLVRHDPGYSEPDVLRSRIRWGNVAFDGEMEQDTPGSDLIRDLLVDDEEAPIYLHAWGGGSTIARALKSIEERYADTPEWSSIRAKVIRKAVIHPSGDQDDTFANYVRPHWPEIRYRMNKDGVELSYLAPLLASPADAIFFSADWTRRNISTQGTLGAFYRVWGDGRQMVEGDIFDYFGIAGKSTGQLREAGYNVWLPVQPAGSFIGEGDTPTFLNLIDNGLRGYRGDSYGGWGGYADPAAQITSMRGPAEPQPTTGVPPELPQAPTHPFLEAAQRDFAARFAWATTADYRAANHPPHIALATPRTMEVAPGERVVLGASVRDPDDDRVTLHWRQWREVGSYAGSVALQPDGAEGRVSLLVPGDVRPGDTLHLIVEATDNGTPALTRYERVVLRVTGNLPEQGS